MNIALDYDGTFTLDPDVWAELIDTLHRNSSNVVVVTSRNMKDPVEYAYWFAQNEIPIIYCDYEAKKDVCERLGVKIDIWVDNDPYYIVNSFNEDVAEMWRMAR